MKVRIMDGTRLLFNDYFLTLLQIHAQVCLTFSVSRTSNG